MNDERNDDIDPVLLTESGRASAAQDLLVEAKAATEATHQLTLAVATALTQQLRRWRWAAVFAIVQTALLSAALVVVITFAVLNFKTLDHVDRQSQDTTEVVHFVRQIQFAIRCHIPLTGDGTIPPAPTTATPCP